MIDQQKIAELGFDSEAVQADGEILLLEREDLVELFVSDLVSDTTSREKVLLFVDKKNEYFLPIDVSKDEDRNVRGLLDMRRKIPQAYKLSRQIFKSMDVSFKDCIFTDVFSEEQKVLLTYEKEGSEVVDSVGLLAQESMSFCLSQGMKFWCSKSILQSFKDEAINEEKTDVVVSFNLGETGNSQKYLF